MHKITYIQIIIYLILSSINTAMADCYTGFACSINDLEKKEQEEIKKDISILKAYIRQKNSKKTIEIINKSNKYEDFFLFNSIFL